MGIKEGKLYAEETFEMYTKSAAPSKELFKGAYLIADGGYHQWRCLQCPTRLDTCYARLAWGSWVGDEGLEKRRRRMARAGCGQRRGLAGLGRDPF